jgi:hypothetical protein
MKTLISLLSRLQKPFNFRHLRADNRSVAAAFKVSAARPHISLKARMLGGQAETITRLGGSTR